MDVAYWILIGESLCVSLFCTGPSLRPPVIQYHIEFFSVSARASRAAACVSCLSSLSLLNYSELQSEKTCDCLVLTTMSDWAANLFSFFQTNVEIKRELRYCDGFKCKSIYFIPQVCVHVVIIICIMMSGKTPGQLGPMPCLRLLPVRPPGLLWSVHRGQHRLGVPR